MLLQLTSLQRATIDLMPQIVAFIISLLLSQIIFALLLITLLLITLYSTHYSITFCSITHYQKLDGVDVLTFESA